MKVRNITDTPYLFLSGDPSLDWVNTLIVDKTGPVDLVHSLEDLIGWLYQARLIDRRLGDSFVRRWANSKEGDKALRAAKQWRKRYHAALLQIESSGKVPTELEASMNHYFRDWPLIKELQVIREKGRLVKNVQLRLSRPEQLVTLLVESAADFLVKADPLLLRKCANPICVLQFYDQSKSHARRWCSMQICGNRTKVAAFYQRAETSSNS